MSETRHSGEPWRRCGQWLYSAEGNLVVYYTNDDDGLHDVCGGADLERIVACVNACAGINPEAVPELLIAAGDAASALGDAPDNTDAPEAFERWHQSLAVALQELCAALALAKPQGGT